MCHRTLQETSGPQGVAQAHISCESAQAPSSPTRALLEDDIGVRDLTTHETSSPQSMAWVRKPVETTPEPLAPTRALPEDCAGLW
eukprot:CAMPEP_0115684122 /NCGR_PEP_ID=MMETSP0272-20121206/58754_1 /TAXON_ID=71861 /ORGANISM="Scrippsiella trochoidea, Strain CCMP3099" /LENGTH=84 /DNA_ID=CAMNT_0003123613 /DNA_START=161 /DNA_END=412 /DNA_ORIENTATION=+